MSILDRKLACNHCRASLAAILDHLEQVSDFAYAKSSKARVVEHEEVDLGEMVHELAVGPVASRYRDVAKQPGRSVVAGAEPVSACLVRQDAA